MPRGNDAQEALRELADKFGKGVGNAEQLIEANLMRQSVALRRAEMLPVDEEATADVKSRLGQMNGPGGSKIVDAAVRGGTTVIVYQDDDDRLWLAALDEEGRVVNDPLPPFKAKLAGASHQE